VALLFLSCLGVGWSIGEAIAGMMGQTGIPVDTKRAVVRDYTVRLGNPAMALFCSVWLGGMVGWALMWLVCCCVGPFARWFPVGAVKFFGEPYSIESSLVGGGSCAFAIPAMTFSTQYNCWEFLGDG